MRHRFDIRHEGTTVILIYNGVTVCQLPWQAGLDLAKALQAQSKKAEEIAKAEQLIFDQALLMRSGAPFGLTNHPQIQAEASKEAQWNSELRRRLPGGVKAKGVVGSPALIRHIPKNPPLIEV